ncbi:MAG: LCP family protein [Candidatus Saccharimonadales bacterium]
MIDYFYYQPDDKSPEESHKPTRRERRKARHSEKPKHHHLLKLVLAAVAVIILAAALLIAAGYWYVRVIPLANHAGRTNLLVLGVDEAAKLSDTIMLISIDHSDSERPKMAIVGIPRDLYVSIPGFDSAKINAAHAYGENYDYRGGGPALTAATIEEHFDIPIHYHLALDFEGFEKIIDAVGGITVEVEQLLEDPFYPAPGYNGYEPLVIEAGEHHFDGQTALRYARSRQTTTSDFDRAHRQQQVVVALQTEIMRREVLTDFSTIRSLLAVFEAHVTTNLTRLEMFKLANLARQLDAETPSQYVIDTSNLLVPVQNEAGSSLVPRSGGFSEIQQFIDNIFDQTEVEEFSR